MNKTEMQQKKCEDCERVAKFYSFIRGDNRIIFKCGYHTWWNGTLMETESKEQLKREFAIHG